MAIIVPVLRGDLGMIRASQEHWAQHCCPFVGSECRDDLALVYAVNSAESIEFRSKFETIVEATEVRNHFAEVILHFADLDPVYDYYLRDRSGMPPTEEGFTSGPNLMFFHVADSIGLNYEACFQMELDCVPVADGWGSRLLKELDRFPDAWIIGSRYHGWSFLSSLIIDHLNGNAIYRFSDPGFQAFISEVWKPRQGELVRWGYPDLAFDCFIALLSSLSRGPLVTGDIRLDGARLFGRVVESDFVVNLGGVKDSGSSYPDIEALLDSHPSVSFIHAFWMPSRLYASLDDLSQRAAIADKSEETEAAMIAERPPLRCCIKHVWLSEESWMFGSRFALLGDDARICMNVLLNVTSRDEIEFSIDVQDGGEVRLVARQWRERLSSERGPLAVLFGFVKAFRFFQQRRGIKIWIRERVRQIESRFGLGTLNLIRIQFLQLRGKRVATGVNEVSFSGSRLKNCDGVVLAIESENIRNVRGKINVRIKHH